MPVNYIPLNLTIPCFPTIQLFLGDHPGVDKKTSGDHFGVDLGIISGLGITSGSGSFRGLYNFHGVTLYKRYSRDFNITDEVVLEPKCFYDSRLYIVSLMLSSVDHGCIVAYYYRLMKM